MYCLFVNEQRIYEVDSFYIILLYFLYIIWFFILHWLDICGPPENQARARKFEDHWVRLSKIKDRFHSGGLISRQTSLNIVRHHTNDPASNEILFLLGQRHVCELLFSPLLQAQYKISCAGREKHPLSAVQWPYLENHFFHNTNGGILATSDTELLWIS